MGLIQGGLFKGGDLINNLRKIAFVSYFGERLFEGGPYLTSMGLSMGAYSRRALIREWALNR